MMVRSFLDATVATLVVLVILARVLHWSIRTILHYRWRQRQRALFATRIAQVHQERDEKHHESICFDGSHNECSTAVARVQACAHKCRRYGRYVLNAITEEFYGEALAMAVQQDTQTVSIDRSPLHGVPISIKECFRKRNSYATGGMACRLLKPRDKTDSLVVRLLQDSGALIVCKTNVTQVMFLPESMNRIWGRSLNPWDRKRTPGGSSGGDAALVAAGCVQMALAADVAGSIRIPASFCGCVGFKSTGDRLSFRDNMRPRKNDKNGTVLINPTVLGPIASSVEDCANFLRTLLTEEMFSNDATIPKLYFSEFEYSRREKLVIGYFDTDEWFEPCATSKRAVQETVARLKSAGHECIPFKLPTTGWYNYGLFASMNAAEGNCRSPIEALEGEEPMDEYKTMLLAGQLPNWLRTIALWFIDDRRANLLSRTRDGGISVYELWKILADIKDLRTQWADAMRGLDALVFPAMPLPAMPHSMSRDLTAACHYMFLANLLNFPAGVVPVTTVRKDEQFYWQPEELPPNQRDVASKLSQTVLAGSEGMPIGVSVMTTCYREETCLRVMKEVERLTGFNARPMDFHNESNMAFPNQQA